MLAIAVGWFVIEFIGLGKFSLFISGDNISVIPYFLALNSSDMPFANWTPFPAAGTDMVATAYKTLVFQWVFAILPSWAAFQVLSVGPILAAILGIYALCRKFFQVSTQASCFAGFAFAVFYLREAFFTSSVQAYLPLTILTLSYLLDNKSKVRSWLGVIAMGLLISHSSLLSRLIPWPIATFLIWFLIIERRRLLVDWLIIALFSIAIMAARWQDVVALLSYAPLSGMVEHRGGGTFDVEMAKTFGTLTGYLFSNGSLPFMFFIGFLVSFKNGLDGRKIELFVALLTFIGLLFLGVYIKVALVGYLPFLSAYNFTYVMQGFGVFIVIAGAIAFDYCRNIPQSEEGAAKNISTVIRAMPICAVVFLLALNMASKIDHVKSWVSWGNLYQNSQNPVYQNIARQIKTQGEPERAMSFQMHGTLLNSYGIETLAGYHPMTSSRYLEFWWKMTEGWHSMPGWKEFHGNVEMGSSTTILPATVGGKGEARVNKSPQWRFADFVNLNLLSLANGGYIASRDRLTDEGLVLVNGPERSWNSLSRTEKIKTNLKANFTGNQHVFVYKNPNVFPRAFTVDQVQVLNSGDEVLDRLGVADGETLSHTVFLEKTNLPLGFSEGTQLSQADIKMRTYQSDHIEMDVFNSQGPTVLVVTNSFSPYWRCRVDGVETTIVPADHAFWGIYIPKGAKEVVFDYRPPYRLW